MKFYHSSGYLIFPAMPAVEYHQIDVRQLAVVSQVYDRTGSNRILIAFGTTGLDKSNRTYLIHPIIHSTTT